MIKLSKNVIYDFSKFINQSSHNSAYDRITPIIYNAMKTIQERNPFINSYELFVANESFSGAVIPTSSLDLFLKLDAPQIELNYNNKTNNPFVTGFINFLRLFKENFKLVKRKKKSVKKLKKEEIKIKNIEKYNIENFYRDLQIQIAKALHKTTTIIINSFGLKIIGNDEFGITINILPVFSDISNNYKIYNISSKKSTIIDFKLRYKNYDKKNFNTSNTYKLFIRILNKVFYNTFKFVPNQIYIESLLYNVPDELFSIDLYESMLKIVNYLKNCSLEKFVSICDEQTLMYKEPLNTITLETSFRFVKSLKFEKTM